MYDTVILSCSESYSLKDTHALINFQYYQYTKYQQLTWAVLSFNIGENETSLLYIKRGEAISEIFVILCNYTILSGINGRILTII